MGASGARKRSVQYTSKRPSKETFSSTEALQYSLSGRVVSGCSAMAIPSARIARLSGGCPNSSRLALLTLTFAASSVDASDTTLQGMMPDEAGTPLSSPILGASAGKHLRPSGLPEPLTFAAWRSNRTMPLGNAAAAYAYAEGIVKWPELGSSLSQLFLVPNLVTRSEVSQIILLLNTTEGLSFDTDTDSVDGMTSHEFFASSEGKRHTPGTEDSDPDTLARRQPVRNALNSILQPIIDKRVSPFIRELYPKFCNSGDPARACKTCTSLVRRYRADERQTHNMHRDGEALATVVVSLSDHGLEYRGGLYVSNGKERHMLALNRGDAVFHQNDLLHGVEVKDVAEDRTSERWSWITWFRDDEHCASHAWEWQKECAEAGDAICQFLYGWRAKQNPAFSEKEADDVRIKYMTKAAKKGHDESMFRVGWSHIGAGNMQEALGWLLRARGAGSADACYALAMIAARTAKSPESEDAIRAVKLLEEAAMPGASPQGGSPKAMFNLGVAHLFGYGVERRDPGLAIEWFLRSAIPEAFFYVALSHASGGDRKAERKWDARARRLGFNTKARKMQQDAGGFALHIWPTTGTEGGPLNL